jgi:hypothetical protein
VTDNVGKVDIPTIQEIEISTSEANEEIDLVDEDSNIVFVGEYQGQEISISFTLTKQNHPSSKEVEFQEEDVKEIAETDYQNNDFVIGENNRGYLSVESVELSESGSVTNIREGTIQGNFLSWPRNVPQDKPIKLIYFDSDTTSELQMNGDILSIDKLEGEASAFLVFSDSDESFGTGLYGDGKYTSGRPDLNVISSISSDADFTFDLASGLYGAGYGTSYGSDEIALNLIASISASFSSNLSASAEVGKIGYGYDYGYDYGSKIYDYGAETYGTGIYGE